MTEHYSRIYENILNKQYSMSQEMFTQPETYNKLKDAPFHFYRQHSLVLMYLKNFALALSINFMCVILGGSAALTTRHPSIRKSWH
jgi:hypothetical protein